MDVGGNIIQSITATCISLCVQGEVFPWVAVSQGRFSHSSLTQTLSHSQFLSFCSCPRRFGFPWASPLRMKMTETCEDLAEFRKGQHTDASHLSESYRGSDAQGRDKEKGRWLPWKDPVPAIPKLLSFATREFFFFFKVVSLHVLMMIEFNKNITVQKRQIRNLHSSQKLICEWI